MQATRSGRAALWLDRSSAETQLQRPAQEHRAPRRREPLSGVRAVTYWSLAGFFFTLAMIGVVLPGIPTTPFLLLMCHFLIRVSPSLHAKALAWPLVGGPLRDWREQGGVRTSVRITACTMVTLLVAASLFFGTLPLGVKAIILLAALYGLSVVIRLPTATTA